MLTALLANSHQPDVPTAGSLQQTIGDFNQDGQVNAADINALCAEISSHNSASTFDLDGNGVVDSGDMDVLVLDVLGTLYGDANLDLVVDGQDFLEWHANRFTDVGGWENGDFNCDGTTDGGDFAIWNDNKFRSRWAFEETFDGDPDAPSQDLLPGDFEYVVTHRTHPQEHFTVEFPEFPADHGEDCAGRIPIRECCLSTWCKRIRQPIVRIQTTAFSSARIT